MTTKKEILDVLKTIMDPDFNKDIVSLGFVKNVQIDAGDVSFDIALTTPACPVKSDFQKKAETVVGKLKGVDSVKVNITTLPQREYSSLSSPQDALKNVRSIVAVSSCKGGVGKSTIAAHLAFELAQRGFDVGLVDVDIHGPSIPTLFNLQKATVSTNQNKQFVPVLKDNLRIMSFGFLLGDSPAVMRGPIVSRYVQQILLNTAWGKLDYLFIDMPPGTGDVQLTITQTIRLSGAVIVTTPQTLSLLDVARGILMFEKVSVSVLGLIENMAFYECDNCHKKHYIFGQNTSQSLKSRFGIETLAEIPLCAQFLKGIDESKDNNIIKQAVDLVIRALGKMSIQQKDVPNIYCDENQVRFMWTDGTTLTVNNRDLRLSCRCALCIHELTGEHLLKDKDIRPDIAAKKIIPLGNYAVGIDWNDGHASGIYPFKAIKLIADSKNSKKT